MYPDWPRSVEDLVPLPQCEGPKLPAFDFKGPQQITFLDCLGEGLHSYVFKVEIGGCEYALKLFCFAYHDDWLGPEGHTDPQDLEAMSAFGKYAEPFNAECRAFGRLREEGYEELALSCYGYVLLDEQHERQLMERFSERRLDFNGNSEHPGFVDVRGHFLGRDGRKPPIRGIVKALGQPCEQLSNKDARRILGDITRMQQLGIVHIDVAIRQLIGGKLADFSTAITAPHFMTTPELNPSLTPDCIFSIEFELFQYTANDFWEFDLMIHEYNEDEGGNISVFAFPSGLGFEGREGLRNTLSRQRIYTMVDPRLFDWKRKPSTTAAGGSVSGRGSKSRSRASQTSAVSKPRRRLAARPPRWYYHCEGEMAEQLRANVSIISSITWKFKDGHIFPVKRV